MFFPQGKRPRSITIQNDSYIQCT